MKFVEQPDGLDTWDEAVHRVPCALRPLLLSAQVRERSARYLRGLLGPVERKNGWQLAEAVGETDPHGIQRLLYAARWDADAVRNELIRFVAESFGDADGIFVMDETGFLKKGTKSVGVQQQYTGTAGKTENCQVGVFLTYVGPQGHAFLDRRLYLPQGWADDAAREPRRRCPKTWYSRPSRSWRGRCSSTPGRWDAGALGDRRQRSTARIQRCVSAWTRGLPAASTF